jgi:hypothetical protein
MVVYHVTVLTASCVVHIGNFLLHSQWLFAQPSALQGCVSSCEAHVNIAVGPSQQHSSQESDSSDELAGDCLIKILLGSPQLRHNRRTQHEFFFCFRLLLS